MNMNDKTLGYMPAWLQEKQKWQRSRKRVEVEVKYLLPRALLQALQAKEELTKQELEQIYLPNNKELLAFAAQEPDLDFLYKYEEWRLRRADDEYFFTAKKRLSGDGYERREFEKEITRETFEQSKERLRESGPLLHINKTRYSQTVPFADEEVFVQIDDYRATKQGAVNLDFVTCEVEVRQLEVAEVLKKRNFFAPRLLFLKEAINLTGIKEFSNRYLAENGFIAQTYEGVLKWLDERDIEKFSQASNLIRKGEVAQGVRVADAALEGVRNRYRSEAKREEEVEISLVQDVLTDLSFKIEHSLGRAKPADEKLSDLDKIGKGWLRDYHQIISANFYIRLHSKPQVFRPGVGYSNTTTRGAHTSDVIANSIQMARQLGLNVDLCMAAAALHDVGHPGGGHVGEEMLFKLSGRRFEHHIFPLSLADVFGLNLLKEVMSCALAHKSGGRKLEQPKGKPQEYGIVRIADKISYCPWDLFDSINNGYLTEDFVREYTRRELGEDIFSILGKQPIEWIWTLLSAAVKESAEAHRVRFSECSGIIYSAYQVIRKLVYEEVHKNINQGTLEKQFEMVYEKIALSFPKLDTVPIVAYITDQELGRLAMVIESEPKNKFLLKENLKAQGFGFVELIELMEERGFDPHTLYYSPNPTDSD